ncbi:hypothetical protein SUGI_0039050 [Cryptomeria japonica]|nr:hypothetical protein SUGI_0039050 [Cryptomeria japonica]
MRVYQSYSQLSALVQVSTVVPLVEWCGRRVLRHFKYHSKLSRPIKFSSTAKYEYLECDGNMICYLVVRH